MTKPRRTSTRLRSVQTGRAGLSLILAVLLPLSAALADAPGFYIETINRSSGMTGEGTTEDLTKTYLAYDKMKVVSEGPDATDMIMDPGSGTLTLINHAEKQFLPIDVKAVMESMSGPAAEQMRNMMGDMTIRVEETGETKQIGEWKTKQYRVKKTGMMGVEQEVWATEDVDLDVTRFNDMMSLSGPEGVLSNSPAGQAQRVEMKKIKGYPILTKTKMEMMGTEMETETEVKVIREEVIPPDVFEIPEGYSMREMGMGMPLQGDGHR